MVINTPNNLHIFVLYRAGGGGGEEATDPSRGSGVTAFFLYCVKYKDFISIGNL